MPGGTTMPPCHVVVVNMEITEARGNRSPLLKTLDFILKTTDPEHGITSNLLHPTAVIFEPSSCTLPIYYVVIFLVGSSVDPPFFFAQLFRQFLEFSDVGQISRAEKAQKQGQ